MYNVSYDYKVATHSTTQRHRIELKLSNPYVASSVPITLTDDHIEAGTLEVVNQCSDQKDLSPGAVYVGQMSVTIANTTPYISPFLRGQWVGGLCELSFFLLVDEEAGVWEKIPMGFYEIASATWTDRGVKIVAYDFMSRFDKPIDTEIVFGIPWQIVTAICQACGVAYGQTAYDVQNYPNANEILGLYPESGISTYREMLSAVVQCVGGFATIGRDGKLYVRRFGDPQNAVDTFDTDQRIVGAKFSDYSTNYSHLVDGQNEDGLAYEWGDYSGATVNLNGNPFLMYGDEDTRNRQHLAILNEIKRWKYVPFTTSILCGAEYDLGDILRFVGGVAGSLSVGLVNKITWKYKKSYTLNGFGINPRLATLGKRGSGKGSSSSKNGSSQKYFKVTNLGDISWITEGYEHASDEKTVGVIDFVSSGENIGEFWAQFQLYANTWTGAMDEAHIRTRAYLDGEMVAEVIDNTTSRGRTLRFLYDGPHDEFKKALYALGEAPIPTYLKRKSEEDDFERFQTIFATNEGAVTAPTAGLHFSRELMKRMEIKGVDRAFITMHCGLGNFRDIDVEDLTKHKMESEQMFITDECCDIVNGCKLSGHKICAIGNTVNRALESVVGTNGLITPYDGWTNKFIFPPYQFSVADSMVSNLQLPYTTQLMLTCAYGGYDTVMHAYNVALKEDYRFGCYGDAMLII